MKTRDYVEKYCTGCGLCHSVQGIDFEEDNRGFPVPIIQSDVETDFFESICPVFYFNKDTNYDVWGNIQKAYVGYSSNENIRFKASSGGALSEICIFLLEHGEVDGILHTTYDSEMPMKTVSVISKTREEIISRCGSRYSISVPLKDFLKMVEPGKKYAFVGKPCDVMSLRNYLDKSNEMKEQFPYLLSFFCAGEPSFDAQKKLLESMGSSVDDCKQLTYRGNGWPGYTRIEKKDGTFAVKEYKDTWGYYLGRDLRNICRFCMDGTGDLADIVCADFWYLDEAGNPDFSEHDGRNIIIARTHGGCNILDRVRAAGNIIVESDFTDKMNEFYRYQPAQYKRKGTMLSTIRAMRIMGRSVPVYSKETMKRYASHLSNDVKVKYFWGIIKRILRGHL